MARDGDSTLSVTGTAYVHGDDRTRSFSLKRFLAAVLAAALVGYTALTTVKTGNPNVGVGLVALAATAVGSALLLELGARMGS